MEVPYKVTVRQPNGKSITKTYTIDKPTLPYLIMRIKSQNRLSDIDWEGPNGEWGTTEIKTPNK